MRGYEQKTENKRKKTRLYLNPYGRRRKNKEDWKSRRRTQWSKVKFCLEFIHREERNMEEHKEKGKVTKKRCTVWFVYGREN